MHILFISEYYPPITMGGGEINLATLVTALANPPQNNPNTPTNTRTEDIKISILTAKHTSLPEIEIHPNLTIYRRLRTGSSPSELLGNLSRLLFLKRSIITQTKKLLEQQNNPIDIIHFIGGTIITTPQLKKIFPSVQLFATIESYPTLCPKGDRWYKQQQPCTVKCTLSTFLTCQSNCSEIGKMKNTWYLKYNPLFLFLTYYYYHQRNSSLKHCHLIAISKYVQNLLAQQNHHSTIIPNILDITPFEQANKKSSLRPPAPRTTAPLPLQLLYLGSLIESKGPHIILQALKDLPSTNYHLNLYGNGIMKGQLQTYITTNNINATIHPPVPFEQIPTIYANADIILFPSLWPEPFGRIPIEAHAAGKIVIASNIGAIPETVNENDTLIAPNDPQILKNAIIESLNNKSFKQTSKKTIPDQKYTPEIIIKQLKKLYNQKTP